MGQGKLGIFIHLHDALSSNHTFKNLIKPCQRLKITVEEKRSRIVELLDMNNYFYLKEGNII